MKLKITEKKQVENLFKFGRTLYFSDISNELSIDLKKVVKICKQLFKEGKIRVHTK